MIHYIYGHDFSHNTEITEYQVILYFIIYKSQTEKRYINKEINFDDENKNINY